jgi:O-antigen ligase
MFRDHPLAEVGIGRFNQEYANYGELYFSEWAYKQGYLSGYVPMISAHNIYLNYLAETGLIGVLLLLTIFSIIVIKGFSLVKKAKSSYIFKYSLLISVLSFLLAGFWGGVTFGFLKEIDQGMIFWSITAIIMSYGAMGKNQVNHFRGRGQTWVLTRGQELKDSSRVFRNKGFKWSPLIL